MPSTELVRQSRDLVPAFKKRGRPSFFDNQEKVDLFAQGLADGTKLKELAGMFGVSNWSAVQYKKDPRMKAAVLRKIEERVHRVTRVVDAKIEERLEEADDLDTDTLLKIRKEFLGGALRLQTQGNKADANTINDAMDEIESNPEFAAELQQLLERQPQPVKA